MVFRQIFKIISKKNITQLEKEIQDLADAHLSLESIGAVVAIGNDFFCIVSWLESVE